MKLYEVANGYMGYTYSHVLVVAPDEQTARVLASVEFAARGEVERQGKEYSNPVNFTVEALCGDLSTPWASDVRS